MKNDPLSAFADQLEAKALPEPMKAPAKRAEAPPDMVNESPQKDTSFLLETGHNFNLRFEDGQERTAKNLPRYAVEFFGSLDSPLLLPRWLFYHELAEDRFVPLWHHDGYAESCGLSSNWRKRSKQLEGVCCNRCGRSLFWKNKDGDQFCVTCHPRKFGDERDLFDCYFKMKGHVCGCDSWL